MLKKETIESLMQIIKEEYNRDLTMAQAANISNTLVDYYQLLMKIYHEENEQIHTKRDRNA